MKGINIKNFTQKQLQAHMPDVEIVIDNLPKRKSEKIKWSVSEHPYVNFHKGSENLYLTMEIYDADPNGVLQGQLHLFTKDNHKVVKEFLKEIIKSL
jgi:hypothetical protein